MIKKLLPLLLLLSFQVEAAITYVGGAQDSEGDNATSLTLTLPSHQADDFCIVHAVSSDIGTDPVLALTVATGWTAIGASPYNHISGADRQNYLWYKKLTSGAETSPTITTDTSLTHSATLNCFRGVDTTTAFDAAATLTVEDDNNADLPDNPAITTQTGAAAVLLLLGITDGAITMTAGAPTNYTLGAYVDAGSTPAVADKDAFAISAYDLDVGSAGAIAPGAWTHTNAAATEDNSLFSIALRPSAAAAVTFSVSPTVTATTATSYTLGYTVSGATTVYFVACNPGESVPNATQVEAGDCGSSADAEGAASEAVSGADSTVISSIAFPRHDIYAIPASGGSVVTLADEDRTEDANQEFVELASVSATSFFALSTDTTGDTTDTSFVIAGMADTSDFAKGMLVDVSAGFSDLTDLLIIEDPTSTSITLEIASNATTANITVTSNVYFNPTVAAGDIVESDSFANPVPSDGTHTGAANAATLTDSTASYTTNELVNSRIANDTDGSACTITANTATTVTCTLTGGTQNDWDLDDAYTILPVITWETDGDFSYTAFSGGVLTTIGYCIQDDSDATGEFTVPACWATDDAIYLFNSPPDFDVMGPFDDILVWDIDAALADVDLANYCTDVDSHTMAFAYTGTPATGVTFNANGTVTGTPTVEDEAGAAMSVLCNDPGQLYARQAFTQYVVDTYTAPDCTDANSVSECAAEWDTAAPWYGDSSDYMTASFDYSDTVADGDIISQSPTESTEVDDPLEPIELVVSLGVQPKGRPGIKLGKLAIGL